MSCRPVYSVIVLFSLALVLCNVNQSSFAQAVRTAILPDADRPVPFILDLQSGELANLSAEQKRDEDTYREAFRAAGDLAYDDAEGGAVVPATGLAARFSTEAERQQLTSSPPKDLVRPVSHIEAGSPGDYLLIRTRQGSYALCLVVARGPKSLEVAWTISPGEVLFRPEDLEALRPAAVEQEKARVLSGKAIITALSQAEPTVFTFETQSVQPLPVRDPSLLETGRDAQELLERLQASEDTGADLLYNARGDKAVFTVGSGTGMLLGPGYLADFAEQDLASRFGQRSNTSAFYGKTLIPGLVIALKAHNGNYALVRIEGVSPTALIVHWAYLPGGTALFPAVAPLSDAVPVPKLPPEPPPARPDVSKRLDNLVFNSGRTKDQRNLRQQLEQFWREGADPNGGINGVSWLDQAADYGSPVMVELLVEAGANVGASAALAYAVTRGKQLGGTTEIVAYLLEHGADVEARDVEGRTAVEVIAQSGDEPIPEVLRLLREHGAGRANLHAAALVGDFPAAEDLLGLGVPVDLYGPAGKTPLHLAAEAGNLEMVALLLTVGADPDRSVQTGNWKIKPIWLAVKNGHREVTALLAEHSGLTVQSEGFYEAVFQPGRETLAEEFLARVPNPLEVVRADRSGFEQALYLGFPWFAELLLEYGMPVPLWAAASTGEVEQARSLLAEGIDVDETTPGSRGETPLQLAVKHQHAEVVKLLLDHGAAVNARATRRSGQTALHDAVLNKDLELATLLLSRGADPNLFPKYGSTPLFDAAVRGQYEIVESLLEYGADPTILPSSTRSLVGRVSDPRVKAILRHPPELRERGAGGAEDRGRRARSRPKMNAEARSLLAVDLLAACWEGDVDAASRALEWGADPGAQPGGGGDSGLHAAADRGHLAVIDLLLRHGAEPRAQDRLGRTPLHRAAAAGHVEVMERLLGAGVEVDAKDRWASTPLHLAAESAQVRAIEFLLSRHADIHALANQRPNERTGITPLYGAVLKGHRDAAELLLDEGADVHARIRDGESLLHTAAGAGHADLAGLLIDRGIPVDVTGPNLGPPLALAAALEHLAVAELLLDRGADPNAEDGNGMTPLASAALAGKTAAGELLLSRGASLERPGEVNPSRGATWPPILLAATEGHAPFVAMLVHHGANVRASYGGETPLVWVARSGKTRRAEVATVLLDAGADGGARDAQHGVAAVHHAAAKPDPELVALLLRRGVDVDTRTTEQRTPLHCAAWAQGPGAVETAALLLRRGAEVNARTAGGQTPLHAASYRETADLAKLLLAGGADVNAKDGKGFTPLRGAVFAGRLEVAEYLIGVGADVNAVDAAGQSLLRFARARNNEAMVDLLRRHGAER